jgi:ComF family protein
MVVPKNTFHKAIFFENMDNHIITSRMKELLQKMKLSLVDTFYPPQCLGCKREGAFLCSVCATGIEMYSHQSCPVCRCESEFGVICYRCSDNLSLDGVFVTTAYENQLVQQLIKNCKYRYAEDVAVQIGDMMWEAHYSFFKNFTTKFVPVPLHRKKKAERGFNITEILARRMSKKQQHSYFDCLRRIRQTESQAQLDQSQRRVNVKDCFQIQLPSIPGGSYCIVDDVASTLSTLNECAKVLKANGADFVWGAVIARGTMGLKKS